MRRILIFLTTLLSLLSAASQANAQSRHDFIVADPQISFPQTITFSAQLTNAPAVSEAVLFIQPGSQDTRLVNISASENGRLRVIYDLTDAGLRPFSEVEYWFRVSLISGEILTSPRYTFLYEDTRFAWQRLASGGLEAAWVEGDLAFGQEIINVAAAGLRAAAMVLPYDPPQPLRVYVYPTSQDLQSSLAMTNTPWAAGHASPDLGVVLVSIPPGPDQRAEMERQLPHEMMHILQYQAVGESYTNLPTWLVEGLASAVELYPNQEYQRALERAVRTDSLLPMVNLCAAFPRDLSSAILAYAQSTSFVRFLHQNYGSSSLQALLNAYKDGLGCEEGVRSVYGLSIAQLEGRWQEETLGRNLILAAWYNLRPYILVLLVILIPVALTLLPALKKGQTAGSP